MAENQGKSMVFEGVMIVQELYLRAQTEFLSKIKFLP